MTLRALIFDVDGTLAETEELHRDAFNAAFANAGLDWSWDRDLYRDLLRTTGGRERILAYAGRVGVEVDAAALHKHKTRIYGERVDAGLLTLRPGIAALIEEGRREGMALAIATTTSRPNVTALIEATLGRDALGWFASIRTGEDVKAKKPDPEVYHLVLSDIGLSARDCIAFEDSQNGLIAALKAGLQTVVTPSLYSADDDFAGAALVIESLEALRATEFHDRDAGFASQMARPLRPGLPATWHRASPDQTQSSLDEWSSREDEPHAQGGNRPTISLRDLPAAGRSPRRLP